MLVDVDLSLSAYANAKRWTKTKWVENTLSLKCLKWTSMFSPRYYDYKRSAEKKEQKTLEAAGKVQNFFVIFQQCCTSEVTWHWHDFFPPSSRPWNLQRRKHIKLWRRSRQWPPFRRPGRSTGKYNLYRDHILQNQDWNCIELYRSLVAGLRSSSGSSARRITWSLQEGTSSKMR